MNQNFDINNKTPLLFHDYDSINSVRNMSSLYFINYYKEFLIIVSFVVFSFVIFKGMPHN